MEKITNTENYRVLKEKFIAYWTSNDLNRIEGTTRDKAFLVYVKGFVDGINFISDMYKQLKEQQ